MTHDDIIYGVHFGYDHESDTLFRNLKENLKLIMVTHQSSHFHMPLLYAEGQDVTSITFRKFTVTNDETDGMALTDAEGAFFVYPAPTRIGLPRVDHNGVSLRGKNHYTVKLTGPQYDAKLGKMISSGEVSLVEFMDLSVVLDAIHLAVADQRSTAASGRPITVSKEYLDKLTALTVRIGNEFKRRYPD